MQLTPKHLAIAGGALLAAVLFAVGFTTWLSHHDALLKLQETIKAQEAKIADFDRAIKNRDQTAQVATSAIAQEQKAAVTPQQQAALVSQWAGLQRPIIITPPAPATISTPAAPAQATIDAPDLARLTEKVGSCRTCEVDRAKLAGDNQDLEGKLAGKQLELDAAKRAATGKVGFWTKLKRVGKVGLCGGVGGGGGAAVAGAKGAAIGAAVGAGVCAAISK